MAGGSTVVLLHPSASDNQTKADRWAVLSAQAQLRGTPLAIIDGLIAATALEHGLTLVTRNIKDFYALPVLTLNPWGT